MTDQFVQVYDDEISQLDILVGLGGVVKLLV